MNNLVINGEVRTFQSVQILMAQAFGNAASLNNTLQLKGFIRVPQEIVIHHFNIQYSFAYEAGLVATFPAAALIIGNQNVINIAAAGIGGNPSIGNPNVVWFGQIAKTTNNPNTVVTGDVMIPMYQSLFAAGQAFGLYLRGAAGIEGSASISVTMVFNDSSTVSRSNTR